MNAPWSQYLTEVIEYKIVEMQCIQNANILRNVYKLDHVVPVLLNKYIYVTTDKSIKE